METLLPALDYLWRPLSSCLVMDSSAKVAKKADKPQRPPPCAVKKNTSAKKLLERKSHVARVNRRRAKAGLPKVKAVKPFKPRAKPQSKRSGRFPRCFVTQQAKTKLPLRKIKCFSKHKRSLRPSITPGTVLILLAGRHKGKRVLFLKALSSGLLLVTGPFRCNGVPLRRVSAAYVIATKTAVDISNVKIPAHLNDSYFKRVQLAPSKDSVDKLFPEEPKIYTVSSKRREDQKSIDRQLVQAILKHPESKYLLRYLSSLFSLSRTDYPHKMIF
ncbi:unnamed protein product [Protopolystoma xenopodis]|uniref:Large ribosomal subunit protein eL6 n=1 Tax=Protopolystoma xenopodis TaxID=117903 RepID=A0A448WEQ1_9PLAT|nr:unnamed protein product [Protopolystoma xenopodis]